LRRSRTWQKAIDLSRYSRSPKSANIAENILIISRMSLQVRAESRQPLSQPFAEQGLTGNGDRKHVFKVLSAPWSKGAHNTLIAFLIREQRY
jgi:hypothetical protein